MRVMDNKLFSVSPKKGYLKPGANQTVTFTYHHTMTGTDRLPVLLKVAGGREIMVSHVHLPFMYFPLTVDALLIFLLSDFLGQFLSYNY